MTDPITYDYSDSSKKTVETVGMIDEVKYIGGIERYIGIHIVRGAEHTLIGVWPIIVPCWFDANMRCTLFQNLASLGSVDIPCPCGRPNCWTLKWSDT